MHDDYDFDGRESGAGTIVGVLILSAIIIAGMVGLMWYLQGPFVGRKLLVALVSPLGLVWLVFFLIAMTATFTKQKFLACIGWLSLVGLSTLGNDSFSGGLMDSLERSNPKYEFKKGESFDYGFVLGGGMSFKKNEVIDFGDANERIFDAVAMYRTGRLKKLVFTGMPFLYDQDVKEFDKQGEPKKGKKRDDQEDKDEGKGGEEKSGEGEIKGDESLEDSELGSKNPFGTTLVSFRKEIRQEKDEKKDETKKEEAKKEEVKQDVEEKSDDKSKQQTKESDKDSKKSEAEKKLDELKKPADPLNAISDDEKQETDKADGDSKEDSGFDRVSREEEERELFLAKLVDMGVKKEDVFFISGRTTFEEVFRIDEFLKDKADAKCALVTSAWHMDRAIKLSRSQTLDLTPLPVDHRSGHKKKNPIFFIPNNRAFSESNSAIREIVASFF